MIQTVKQENKAVNEKLIHTTYFNNETSSGFGSKANIMFADNSISDLPFGMYHVIFTINTLSVWKNVGIGDYINFGPGYSINTLTAHSSGDWTMARSLGSSPPSTSEITTVSNIIYDCYIPFNKEVIKGNSPIKTFGIGTSGMGNWGGTCWCTFDGKIDYYRV